MVGPGLLGDGSLGREQMGGTGGPGLAEGEWGGALELSPSSREVWRLLFRSVHGQGGVTAGLMLQEEPHKSLLDTISDEGKVFQLLPLLLCSSAPQLPIYVGPSKLGTSKRAVVPGAVGVSADASRRELAPFHPGSVAASSSVNTSTGEERRTRRKGENEGLAAKQAKERTRGRMLRCCEKVQKKEKKRRKTRAAPRRHINTEPLSGLPG